MTLNKLGMLVFIILLSLVRTIVVSVQTLGILFAPSPSFLESGIALLTGQIIFAGITVLVFKHQAVRAATGVSLLGLLFAGWPLAVLLGGFSSTGLGMYDSEALRELLPILGQMFILHLGIIPTAWLFVRVQKRHTPSKTGWFVERKLQPLALQPLLEVSANFWLF